MPLLGDSAVILRAFRADDAELVQKASSDPLIPLITSVPTTTDLDAAHAFIVRQHSRSEQGVGYSFAIAEAATDAAVGQIGLWLHDIRQGRASVGYWIAAAYRRRGLGRHALAVISAWGLALPDVERLELYVEPWNESSWRTAEGVGYQREGLLRSWQSVGSQRRDMYMYSLLP